ncbi:50S ribosome-binding GTPase [Sulfobacillus thermosulfidooxidans DSM 9293]|uniref:50S ribosome-binding GTPase n=2 Tax=Sulfobacillus thermosulfidooxidans TaxID=28034 RepID=A0A1W1WLN4_SULTA|nr:GTPase domain-containing protein [Sulfobacillus thermosulfidooxidans]PSR29742.1 MAG: hypothetical protein C7B47_00035 [Sulfobacillus thermosulfidooxidans]SMC07089.1 50S ribosome-binding GTPase [Sulfobacillus thermosulfidooxidans DSM 9293]
MEALVIGKPNVGKSLFVINFAAYLGVKEIRLQWTERKEIPTKKISLSLDEARHKLVSQKPHKTLTIQSMSIEIMTGRQKKTLWIVDSVGLTEGIHHQAEIRQAMANTLIRMGEANVILHMIDLSSVGSKRIESFGPLDDEMANYSKRIAPYLILGNKIDKPGAIDNLHAVREHFKGIPVIGVSALTRRGFKEVKAFTLRHLDA